MRRHNLQYCVNLEGKLNNKKLRDKIYEIVKLLGEGTKSLIKQKINQYFKRPNDLFVSCVFIQFDLLFFKILE